MPFTYTSSACCFAVQQPGWVVTEALQPVKLKAPTDPSQEKFAAPGLRVFWWLFFYYLEMRVSVIRELSFPTMALSGVASVALFKPFFVRDLSQNGLSGI